MLLYICKLEYLMKICKGHTDHYYVVFCSEDRAMQYRWFFGGLLRRHMTCFNGYMNAYHLW